MAPNLLHASMASAWRGAAVAAAASDRDDDHSTPSSHHHKDSSDVDGEWLARRYFIVVGAVVILALLYLAYYYRRTFFNCCVDAAAQPGQDRQHLHFRGPASNIPEELSFAYLYGRFSRDGESTDPFFHSQHLNHDDQPDGGFRRVIARLRSHRRVIIYAGLPLRSRLPHVQHVEQDGEEHDDVELVPSPTSSIVEGSDDEHGHVYVAMPAAAETGVELYNIDRILLDGREPTHNNPFGSNSSRTYDDIIDGSPDASVPSSPTHSKSHYASPYGQGYYTDVHGAVAMDHSISDVVEVSAFVDEDELRDEHMEGWMR